MTPATAKTNLLGMSPDMLEQFFAERGEKAFRARQVLQWIHQRRVTDFDAMTDLSKKLREQLQRDAEVVLPRVICPALLIAADPARGGMIDAESAAVFQSFVPQLRAITIAGAGHCVRYEQFDRYMDIVRGFLAGVTATT